MAPVTCAAMSPPARPTRRFLFRCAVAPCARPANRHPLRLNWRTGAALVAGVLAGGATLADTLAQPAGPTDAAAAEPWPAPAHADPDVTALRAWRLPAGQPPVRLDGRLDDPAWALAPRHGRFSQWSPQAGAPVPDGLRTEVQFVVDAHALVVGVRAWATEPPQVLLSRRDTVAGDQDYIGLWLDSAGRREAALFVKASLAGVVSDGLLRVADDEEDPGPDHPVAVAVARLADGYSMEIRWPLAALRYPYDGERPWQVVVARSVPAAGHLLLVSGHASPDAPNLLHASLPLSGLEDTLRQHRDQTEGQWVAEWTGRRWRDPGGPAAGRGSLGLEGWWRPRADWLFNATLNPDFAQVDIDAPQASGQRNVALALPEKRRYFLESADVMGLTPAAFYSRTVADPRWGLRGTWRGAQADATALLLEDRAGARVLRGRPWGTETWQLGGASQALLVRGRQQFTTDAGGWTQGLMAARRQLGGGVRNQVLGHDGLWRHSGDDGSHLQTQWSLMASDNTIAVDADGHSLSTPQTAERGWRAWGKSLYVDEHWFNLAEAGLTSPGFVNTLGFADLGGLWQAHLELNRRLGEQRVPLFGWPLHQTEWHLGLHELRTLADTARAEPGGEVIRRELRLGGWLAAPGRTEAWLQAGADQQRAGSGRPLRPTPALHGGLETTPWPWLPRLELQGSWGRQLDSDRDRVGQGGWWALQARSRWALPGGQSLELDPTFTGLNIGADGPHGALDDRGLRLLALWHLDARRSLRAILQDERSSRGRSADAPAQTRRSRHRSLMWRQRLDDHWSASLGLQWDQASPEPSRREWFAKLQWTPGAP